MSGTVAVVHIIIPPVFTLLGAGLFTACRPSLTLVIVPEPIDTPPSQETFTVVLGELKVDEVIVPYKVVAVPSTSFILLPV